MLQYEVHKGAQNLVKDLNKLYKKEKALHQKQFSPEGFEWIDHGDHENCVLSYIRKGENEKENIVIVLNLTPIPRENYRIGLPKEGNLKEVFNSDAKKYKGTGAYTNKKITTEAKPWNNRAHSTAVSLPPLAMIALKYQ